MATNATGTVTSPDSIARLAPADQPDMSSLTGGVNAISDTVQTALTASYPRIVGAKSTNNGLFWNGTNWVPAFATNANIAAGAGIVYSKLSLTSSIVGGDLVNDIALPGNPTTTTQAVDNATTRLATTAYVTGQASAVAPNPDNILTAAAVGTSTRYARADHTHKVPTGIFDSAGSASRLNPIRVGTFYEDGGPAFTWGLGDGIDYRASGTGWGDFSVGDNGYITIPWSPSGWAAAGGTLTFRILFWMLVTSNPGGSARTVNLKYITIDDQGNASSVTGWPNGTGLSYGTGTGLFSFDTGYQTVTGAALTDGQLVVQLNTNRVGGANGVASRSGYTVIVKNA